MPELLDIVVAGWSVDAIGDQKKVRLLKFDAAAVVETSVTARGFEYIAL